jgi:hypothetical protein
MKKGQENYTTYLRNPTLLREVKSGGAQSYIYRDRKFLVSTHQAAPPENTLSL